ncbi:MAG: protein kinase [Minicystis sp.]
MFLARGDDDEEEVVKVLDFGIAKDVGHTPIGEGTKTGELMGSPHYMSPEQVRGSRDIDHRSDLWSLSVIMFRALTGRMPFNGDNVGAVIAQILADPIPVATQVAPDLPPALDAFFMRGFARDREQRFQTAREMAEAFAAIATAAGSPADANARWSTMEEPPTRPRLPSHYPSGAGADLVPSSIARPEMPSIPTESMPALAEAPTPAPASSAFGGTGGPVIHTAPPPAPARPSLLRWLPLAGAAAGVLIGTVAFLAVRPRDGVKPAAAASAMATSAVATAAPQPEPAATAVATAAPSQDAASGAKPAATAEPAPSAVASAAKPEASAPASASAAPSSKPAAKAKDAKPAQPSAKKKPNWGF